MNYLKITYTGKNEGGSNDFRIVDLRWCEPSLNEQGTLSTTFLLRNEEEFENLAYFLHKGSMSEYTLEFILIEDGKETEVFVGVKGIEYLKKFKDEENNICLELTIHYNTHQEIPEYEICENAVVEEFDTDFEEMELRCERNYELGLSIIDRLKESRDNNNFNYYISQLRKYIGILCNVATTEDKYTEED